MSNKVTPKVGQVWENNGNEYKVKQMLDGFVNMWASPISAKLGIAIDDGFYSVFTFVPQNDLEWLAVNVHEWNCQDSFQVICKADNRAGYHHEGLLGCYTRKQWQNKRYYLGLDKKPHYKMINGEWVK